MPKSRKAKKIKTKKKAKKRSSKKKAPEIDERVRNLLVDVVDRMGGSIASQEGVPSLITVARFNAQPFVINLQTCQVEDVGVSGEPSSPAVEVTIPSGQSSSAA